MQLFNSNQQIISTCDRANEPCEQTLALEKAQDEIELLREQIASLQQYFCEQLWQQRAVELEQELHEANQALEQLNLENQRLIEKKLLFLKEMEEFARSLSANRGTDRRALRKLLNKFCADIAPAKKLEPVKINSEQAATMFRSNRASKFGMKARNLKESNLEAI